MAAVNKKGVVSVFKVAIVYHMWPHYRRAVMEALDRSVDIQYEFIGSGESYNGIVHVDPTAVKRFRRISFRSFGRFWIQLGSVPFAAQEQLDAIVFLGNPNFLTTWIAAWIARARGISVLFWEHGWRRHEGAAKSAMRLRFFRLADRLLVYAPRAKLLGIEAGYPAHRIDVVWNSLDTVAADQLYGEIKSGTLADVDPAHLFASPGLPILICTARLTEVCRFDLLLEAVAILKREGIDCNVLLVGAGDAGPELKRLATRLELPVHFFGACYEERVLSQLLYRSSVTVSPGKVGLTAMHSMMYGTPVITHDNDDEQMPEVEAIREGQTGARFVQNNPASLAAMIRQWIGPDIDRESVREACRLEIAARWNPEMQARLIERAVKAVIGEHLRCG